MALQALGHHVVIRPLGHGGMGQVFLARDTRLNREVALKCLPDTLARDRVARERFEREAKAIAALNHPNIVTIYAVEDAEGVPFYTMEYVPGQTLQALIPAEGLPLDRVLDIAIAIGDALAAAHEHGILHRDIKPANVMVTADGRVKVLDFGLAQLKGGFVAGDATTLEALTVEGQVLGTVAYMSPEQAQGRPLDQRTDLFSLGVVLYEMASGRRPFTGDSQAAILSAILRDTPPPIHQLKPGLPQDLTRIVTRALTKDPEHRYQTAKDFRNDLELLRDECTAGHRGESASEALHQPRARRWRPAAVLALAAAAVGALLYMATTRRDSRGQPFASVRLTSLTADGRAGRITAISPDGNYVVRIVMGSDSLESLAVQHVATSSRVQVVPPADVIFSGVAFSPDGSYIYYSYYASQSRTSALFRIPVLGGAPEKLPIDDIDTSVTFAPDGRSLAYVRNRADDLQDLMVADADGRGAHALATSRDGATFAWVSRKSVDWSPDGRSIAVAIDEGQQAHIGLVDVTTGAITRLGRAAWKEVTAVEWLPEGRGVLCTALDPHAAPFSQIWVVEYPAGEVHQVSSDFGHYFNMTVSGDGRTIVALRGDLRSSLQVAPGDRPDEGAPVSARDDTFDGYAGMEWTPQGGLVYSSWAGGRPDLWLLDRPGGEARRLTNDAEVETNLTVAPDGRIVFASSDAGGSSLWRIDADGSNRTRLTPGPSDTYPLALSNASIVFTGGRLDVPQVVTLDGGDPEPLASVTSGPGAGHVPREFVPRAASRDGRLLAGWYPDEGGYRLGVVAVDGARPPTAFPVVRWINPAMSWAPDGRSFVFIDPRDDNLWRQALDGKPPTRLTSLAAGQAVSSVALSLDGRWLAYSLTRRTRDVVLLREGGT